MNEFVLDNVKILIKHINGISLKRGLPYKVTVNTDLINNKELETITLSCNNLLIEENKNPSIIVSSSITVPYNQYLDDKENIIYWLNEFLYDDILTHTIFEQELNNKNDKYKWN